MPWIPDTSTAFNSDEPAEFENLDEKTTPVDEDLVVIEDSEDSFAKKKVQLGNLPGGGGTDADAIHDNVAAEIDALTEVIPVAGDWVLIEDASDSFNKKKVDADEFLGGGSGPNVPGWIIHLAERRSDETSNGDDDFFDDDDHSAWTKQTVGGTAVWEELDGILSVQFHSQGSGDLAAALLPLTSPSAPVTLETAINAVTAQAEFYTFGIGFADGTGTGDDIALIRYVTSAPASSASHVVFQSAGTLTDFTGGVNNNLADIDVTGGLLYLRIVWDTTNTFSSQISSNGRNWRTIGSTFSRTMTPTHAVLLASANGGGTETGVASFHYLRRNNNDPT